MKKLKIKLSNLTDTQRKILYYSVIILVMIGLITGLSFAWFSATVTGNDTAKSVTVETANLSIVYTNNQELNGTNITPGWNLSKSFTVTNNSNVTAYYDLIWANLTNTFTNKSDLVYSISSTNDGRTLRETALPETGTDIDILKNIEIEAGVTQTYTILVKYKETNTNQNIDQGKVLKGKIEVKEASNLQRLPHEYQEVEFIESTGTQYIDTNYKTTPITDTVEIKFQFSYIQRTMIAGFNSNNDADYEWWYSYYDPMNGTDRFTLALKYDGINESVNLQQGVDNKKHTLKRDKLKVYWDENYIKTITATKTNIVSSINFLLFQSRSGYNSRAKIYSVKIANNDILLRDLVPCYRKNDKKPGMYDLVNDVFYTNAGSGEFLIP